MMEYLRNRIVYYGAAFATTAFVLTGGPTFIVKHSYDVTLGPAGSNKTALVGQLVEKCAITGMTGLVGIVLGAYEDKRRKN